MRVIDWPRFLEETPPQNEKPSAVTVGIFDGVHRGHKALIEEVVSQRDCAVPVVVTFRQGHYKKTLRSEKNYPGDILSFRQRMGIFESMGVSLTIVIEFSESFRKMSGAEFLRILGEHGKMRFMAVGVNFHCGYRMDTDALAAQEINAGRGILTRVVPSLTEDRRPISSSQIRSAITLGKLREAAAMLGRPFTVDLLDSAVDTGFSGDSPSSGKTGYTVYDIAGQGRILPPPGKYQVLLIGKDRDKNAGTPAWIQVENGKIIIDSDGAMHGGENRKRYEYIEFLLF